MNTKRHKAAMVIGMGLALVQDTTDRVVAWGFSKLKDVEKDSKPSENKIINAAKKTGGFIGETGSEYYKAYEKLKARRESKEK